MKLLVTGGAGFIGSNFIRYILRERPEWSVVNLDALTYAGNLENLADIESANLLSGEASVATSRYRFVKGDITNADLVRELVEDCDAILHFAAESHVDRSIIDPGAFMRTNILGTATLLNAAREAGGKRFHHISTDEVFGALDLDAKEIFNENTPYNPHSPYSASKAAADHLVRAYFHTYGLPITISNCSNNFGPYQFPEKIIPLFITNLIDGKKVPLYGDGLYVRDWLHVEDHCEAILLILEKGKIGETYCVGGNAERNNLFITNFILQEMGFGEEMIERVKDRPGHDRRYAIDSSKIRAELGWTPRHDFESGLRETIEWYRTHESWWRKIKSGKYLEYYQKQYGDAKNQ